MQSSIIYVREKLLAIIFLFIAVTSLWGKNNPHVKGGGIENNPTPAANCAAATAVATIELNNVRARIEGTGGTMWQDRSNGIAFYNIPKQQTSDDLFLTSIFAGALWIAGEDVTGQLKLAAATFRQAGNDFWPGPLNTTTAEIDPETCSKFDEYFGVSRPMIDQFVAWYQAGLDDALNGTTTQIDNFPNYRVPEAIQQWPGNGDPALGQDIHLAPFFDRNGDDFYDWEDGDYPKYDIEGLIDCRTQRDVRLFGDTTIWFVFNDKGNIHTESQGASIGMEIRGQAFAFATDDEVNNMTFYNYELINRSTFTLTETFFSQWVDADIGFNGDDFVGCDASRGLGFCYNGDAVDDGGSVDNYGSTPPAVGVDFFEGPFADSDYERIGGGITTNIAEAVLDANGNPIGIDNPLTEIVQDALDSNGIPYQGLGIGYGDGIPNNERYGMRKFLYYNRNGQFPGDGDPITAQHYYNYMRGIWQDGSNVVWGATGHVSGNGNVVADFSISWRIRSVKLEYQRTDPKH